MSATETKLSLVGYSDSSSDSESELDSLTNSNQLIHKNDDIEVPFYKGKSLDSEPRQKKAKIDDKQALPLPDGICQMFQDKEVRERADRLGDPTLHGGRKRSFAHAEGNWATSIHIATELDEHWQRLRTELFVCLRPSCDFKPMDEHHLSLSRTVVIRHHWIESLVESLRDGFTGMQRFTCCIHSVRIYTNDEKTRSFLGLQVMAAAGILKQLSSVVDGAFSEYNLPPYYTDPSYHISIGWDLGDVNTNLSPEILSKMQIILECFLDENPDSAVIDVHEICLKTGNKLFTIPLLNKLNL